MQKYIHLKFVSVKHSGKPIGNDIRIEVRCRDLSSDIKKKMKKGTEVQLNQEIGKIYADQTPFTLPVSIKIIENDIIFNDIGMKEVNIKVNLSSTRPQISTHDIEIKEKRGNSEGSKSAIFSLTLEASVHPVYIYAPSDTGGWLSVKRTDGKEDISLPTYLKVRLDDIQAKHESLTIEEGHFKGVQVVAKMRTTGMSYFLRDDPQTGPVSLFYSLSKKTLKLGKETYKTTDDPHEPWKTGIYDIEIPDAPHRGGKKYPELKYPFTWFLIGHTGNRYLHTGVVSKGCITVIERNRWDSLCDILMRARKGDGLSIGTLTITK